jgi:putative ubiquitin-RnfH superfamily antitoxin RatB of RatAB toxin-antitoxin module
MHIVVAYAAPGIEWLAEAELPASAILADALAATGAHAIVPAAEPLRYAIFGETAALDTPLVDGDRVELTRPLVADPKTVRRERARERPLRVRAKPPKRGRKAESGA